LALNLFVRVVDVLCFMWKIIIVGLSVVF